MRLRMRPKASLPMRSSVARPRKVDRDRVEDASGPRAHHHDDVGEIDRLGEAMRNEEHGLAGLLPDVEQVVAHAGAGLLVERRERLVHQDQARVLRQPARDRDPLAHAARQLVRIVLGEVAQAHELEQRGAALAPRGARDPAQVERELDVGERGLPRQQGRVLEHHADLVGHGRRNRLTVDAGLAAGRPDQARQDLQQRGLAAAARSDQGDELPFGDRERDVGERLDRRAAGAEFLAQFVDFDDRRGHQAAAVLA